MIAPSAVQRAKVDHRNMSLGVTTLFSSSWLFKGIFSFEKYEKLRNILEISFLSFFARGEVFISGVCNIIRRLEEDESGLPNLFCLRKIFI